MRENRPYGSEGGEAQSLPDPYQRDVSTEADLFKNRSTKFMEEAL